MTYTTPKTWSDGEILTAADLNTYVRDNQIALKDPPTDYVQIDGADYSTSSTIWVDVDNVDLSLNITTTGGDVLIGFSGTATHSTAGLSFTVAIDGTQVAGDGGIINISTGVDGTYSARPGNASFVVLARGLSAGPHTITLQWKVSNGSAVLWAGATTTGNRNIHPMFWAREV